MRAYRACADSFALLEKRFPELLPHPVMSVGRVSILLPTRSLLPHCRRSWRRGAASAFRCEWLDSETLQARFGCARPGAILSSLGAQVDPYRLARALFAASTRHGVRLFARTKVVQHRRGCRRTASAHRAMVTWSPPHTWWCAAVTSRSSSCRTDVAEINNTFALVTEPLARRERLVEPATHLGERAPVPLYTRHARWPADRGRRGCAIQEQCRA